LAEVFAQLAAATKNLSYSAKSPTRAMRSRVGNGNAPRVSLLGTVKESQLAGARCRGAELIQSLPE